VILLAARILLAAVFALAGVTKLQSREETEGTLESFGVSERMRPGVAIGLPLTELALATALVPAATARWAALAAFVLLATFTFAVARVLRSGAQVECNCFGALHSAPVGTRTLVRNLALAALAGALVISGPGESLAALDGRTVLAVAAAAAGVLLLGLTWFSWQLFRQNGRLLGRVRALEEARAAPTPSMPRIPGPPEAVRGLREGELVPDLVLRGVDGGQRSLRELAHMGPAPIALVFSDPGCASCHELTRRLPALREELDGVLELVLITRGDASGVDPPATQGMTVLIQEDREALVGFAIGAVPAAVVLDAEGRVASLPALGEVAVEELLLSTCPERDPLEVIRVAKAVG